MQIVYDCSICKKWNNVMFFDKKCSTMKSVNVLKVDHILK